MHCHGALAAQRRLLPDGFIEHLGGEHLSGVCHQKVQNGVLRGREGHRFPLHGDGFGAVVQDDAANGDAAAALLRAAAQLGIPAQLGTHPRQYLHRHKGLGDIVVRPHVQPQHLVLRLGLGGKQNDGRVGKFPDFGGRRDTVHHGHHHVQQNQVDVIVFRNFHRLGAGEGLKQIVPLGGQVYFQRVDDIRLIVANQNVVHMVSLPLVIFFSYYITGFFKMKEVYFLKCH